MLKHVLAQQLRQRQYEQNLVPRSMVDALSDDEIIDTYITCSGCGEKQVTPEELVNAIAMADDAGMFFSICDDFNNHRH